MLQVAIIGGGLAVSIDTPKLPSALPELRPKPVPRALCSHYPSTSGTSQLPFSKPVQSPISMAATLPWPRMPFASWTASAPTSLLRTSGFNYEQLTFATRSGAELGQFPQRQQRAVQLPRPAHPPRPSP